MPFSAFQNGETLKSYTLAIYRLVLFLVRLHPNTNLKAGETADPEVHCGYTLTLPDDIHAMVGELVSLYEGSHDHDGTDYAAPIHKLLVAIWTREWFPTEGNIEPDPTMQVAALMSLSETGTFADGAHTTGSYARFQACMVSPLRLA